jgi:hypothetical protein
MSVTIKKETIKKIVREVLQYIYIPQPPPGTFYFYCRIPQEDTGLGVEIMIDDSQEYKMGDHPLWVYVRSHKNVSQKKYPRYYKSVYIPFTVEKNPRMVGDTLIVGELLSSKDIKDVKDFISLNVKELRDVSNMKVSSGDFSSICTPIDFTRRYDVPPTNKVVSLNEMANILKRDSGLPVNIWVDNSGKDRLNKHSPDRIKFQNNKGNSVQPNTLIPISVHDSMVVFSDDNNIKITSHELSLIRKFIEVNIELVVQLIHKEIKPEEFKKRVIKLDKKGNLIYPKSEVVSYKLKGKYVNGFRIVVSNNGLYNFIDTKGNLVSNQWFSVVYNFMELENDQIVAPVKENNMWYYLYPDGKLEKYHQIPLAPTYTVESTYDLGNGITLQGIKRKNIN